MDGLFTGAGLVALGAEVSMDRVAAVFVGATIWFLVTRVVGRRA